MTDPTSSESQIAHNLAEYSVSELSLAIRRTLEDGFERVRVRGEISGFKRAASGHLYMMLKDENAALKAVCWKGIAGKIGFLPADGMEVVALGRVTSYAERSEYQMVIERLEIAGVGALLKMIEDRRLKLAAEGLFDAARKRPLPVLPRVIGVITSPTGAVIRDILHRLEDRFPRHVLLWPVLVQGEGAAEQVTAAIHGFNALPPEGGLMPRPDLLIVARGGGSVEDLMAFNEENLVRAAAASTIPLISAVGHETDTTLIDYAADRRAPTPTAAAEMAVPVRAALLAQIAESAHRLGAAIARQLSGQGLRLDGLARGLPEPRRLLQEKAQTFDQWVERWHGAHQVFFGRRRDQLAALGARLTRPEHRIAAGRAALDFAAAQLSQILARQIERFDRAFERVAAGLGKKTAAQIFTQKSMALTALGQLLESYSYEQVLGRGFVLVRNAEGHPLTAAADVAAGERLLLQFHDGARGAIADGDDTPKRMSGKNSVAARKSPGAPSAGSQGSLL